MDDKNFNDLVSTLAEASEEWNCSVSDPNCNCCFDFDIWVCNFSCDKNCLLDNLSYSDILPKIDSCCCDNLVCSSIGFSYVTFSNSDSDFIE